MILQDSVKVGVYWLAMTFRVFWTDRGVARYNELYHQVKADREKHPGDDGSQISTMIFVTTN